MNKYLVIILIFLIIMMGIAITKQPPNMPLFYIMLGRTIITIIYSSKKKRKEQDKK